MNEYFKIITKINYLDTDTLLPCTIFIYENSVNIYRLKLNMSIEIMTDLSSFGVEVEESIDDIIKSQHLISSKILDMNFLKNKHIINASNTKQINVLKTHIRKFKLKSILENLN